MTKTYPPITELDWFKVKPNQEIDPRLFTGSMTKESAIFSGPLGWDYLFCRGVDLVAGITPHRELYYLLRENYNSKYRPGVVNTNDKMSESPTRNIQFPKASIELFGGLHDISEIPKFGRTRPDKVFVTEDHRWQFTFSKILVPKQREAVLTT